ncbi:MAG: hypothetical protein K8R35_03285, partial [Bacteroidales bacterium]|nr:hypothetical protein [Bacteroidales bacterium]
MDETHNNPPDTGDSVIERTGTRPVPALFEIIGAFKSITSNGYIIMPNHIHGIIVINNIAVG